MQSWKAHQPEAPFAPAQIIPRCLRAAPVKEEKRYQLRMLAVLTRKGSASLLRQTGGGQWTYPYRKRGTCAPNMYIDATTVSKAA